MILTVMFMLMMIQSIPPGKIGRGLTTHLVEGQQQNSPERVVPFHLFRVLYGLVDLPQRLGVVRLGLNGEVGSAGPRRQRDKGDGLEGGQQALRWPWSCHDLVRKLVVALSPAGRVGDEDVIGQQVTGGLLLQGRHQGREEVPIDGRVEGARRRGRRRCHTASPPPPAAVAAVPPVFVIVAALAPALGVGLVVLVVAVVAVAVVGILNPQCLFLEDLRLLNDDARPLEFANRRLGLVTYLALERVSVPRALPLRPQALHAGRLCLVTLDAPRATQLTPTRRLPGVDHGGGGVLEDL